MVEGRWMRNKTILDDYTLFWYRGGGNLHKYSQCPPTRCMSATL
jgi:hypothetical protein